MEHVCCEEKKKKKKKKKKKEKEKEKTFYNKRGNGGEMALMPNMWYMIDQILYLVDNIKKNRLILSYIIYIKFIINN